MDKFQGIGWYIISVYREGCPVWAGEPEAVWVDSAAEFEGFSKVPEGCEIVISYLGSDDLPEDGYRVGEHFVAAFSPEQATDYVLTVR